MSSILSTASSDFSPLSAFLITLIASSSSVDKSRSSRLVPDFGMSMAGNTLFSESFRSRTISIFPVPLNSSYTTSSIFEPVSTSAVASMVRLPPSRIFLAAPKKRFGICSAAGSRPPESVLPLGGTVRLYARVSLVMLSSRIHTSFLCSTRRFARSITISATLLWWSGSSSKVE